jgi:hypothetical protein
MSSEPVCEVSKKLLDLEQRSIIKFLTKEGKNPKEILERMVAVYGESAPSYYKVKFWSKQFKWGRQSIEDDPHTGRPVEETSEEMCQNLESLNLAYRQMKVSRLAEETGISAGAVWNIIHEKLDISKVSARRVPRMLSPFQDTCRKCCQENLELLTEDSEYFFQRLVTGDETLVYHRDPESKLESMQWKHKTSPPLKCLGLKNLLAKSWQLFCGMRTSAFTIHATEDYHNWTDLC